MKQVDFLDVTFDRSKEKFKPYRKPNDRPVYVNTGSNHPQVVLKKIPEAINKGLSSISITKKILTWLRLTIRKPL